MNFLGGFWSTKPDIVEPSVRRYRSYDELPYTIYRPSIQRAIMDDSVLSMRQHIRESIENKNAPIFGVIDVCILDGVAYVIDGQHRLKALEDEWMANKFPVSFFIMEYQVANKTQLEFIFVTRNKGIPVPSYILSDDIECKKREFLKGIQTQISKRPLFVSTTGKSAYRPKVCIGEFMDQLSRSRLFSEIWDKYSDRTIDELVTYFDEILDRANIELARLATDTAWVERNHISTNMIAICYTNRSYFGLTVDRLYFEEFFLPRRDPITTL